MHTRIKKLTLAMAMTTATVTFANDHTGAQANAHNATDHATMVYHAQSHIDQLDLIDLKVGEVKVDDVMATVRLADHKYPMMQLVLNGIAIDDIHYDASSGGSSGGSFEIGEIALYGMGADQKDKTDLFHIKDFSLESKVDYNDKTHLTGNTEVKLSSLHFENFWDNGKPHMFTLTDLKIVGDTKNQDKRVVANGDMSFKQIDVDNVLIGPFELKFGFNVDKHAYINLVKYARQMSSARRQLNSMSPEDRRKFYFWMQENISRVMSDLMAAGVDASVDKFTLTTPDGTISGRATFHSDSVDKKDSKMTANIQLEAPVKVVTGVLLMMHNGNEMQAKQALNGFVNQGILVKDGDMLRITASFDDGKGLVVNGKTLSFKPVLSNKKS